MKERKGGVESPGAYVDNNFIWLLLRGSCVFRTALPRPGDLSPSERCDAVT